MATSSDHRRLVGLDALRGIAALCVIFQHAAQFTVEYTPLYSPVLGIINLGRFGVILFFLISGFLVPSSLGRAGLIGFGLNRSLRLLPVLWVSVFGLTVHFALLGADLSSADILANMTMLAWPSGSFQLSIGYWTLSVELGFYLFAAFLFATNQLRNFRLIGTCGIVFALLGARINYEVVVFYGYLLAGMTVRQVYDGERAALPWMIAIFATLLFADLQLARHAPLTGFLQPLSLATGMIAPAPVFLFVVFRRPEMSRMLIWFGTISYPLYLLQDFGLYGLLPINQICAPLYPAGVFALTISMAIVVHRLVEEPALARGRILTRQWLSRRDRAFA